MLLFSLTVVIAEESFQALRQVSEDTNQIICTRTPAFLAFFLYVRSQQAYSGGSIRWAPLAHALAVHVAFASFPFTG